MGDILFCTHHCAWTRVVVCKCIREFTDGITLHLCFLLFSSVLISWSVPEISKNFFLCLSVWLGFFYWFEGLGWGYFCLWRRCNTWVWVFCVDRMYYFTRSIFLPRLQFNCYCNLGKYLCNEVLFLSKLIEALITVSL